MQKEQKLVKHIYYLTMILKKDLNNISNDNYIYIYIYVCIYICMYIYIYIRNKISTMASLTPSTMILLLKYR